jgi:hypothetical protein
MANELKCLSDIFHNRLFRIPDYQRGYAWGKEQLLDFWEDLLNLAPKRYHYTGLLSLKEVKQHNDENKTHADDKWLLESGYKLFHVVDGQQRLTTFQILLNQIVVFVKNLPQNKDLPDDQVFLGTDSIKNIKEKYIVRQRPPQNFVTTYIFGYEVDDPSCMFLKHKIFGEPNTQTLQETFYTQNLMNAKKFFEEVLDVLFKQEGLAGIENIFKKLTLHFMFNLHEIEDDYDVFVAFETMNNRGKKLSNLELLKNRLIYLTTLYGNNCLDELDKQKLRDAINNAWKEVYYQLGRNQDSRLPDDDFLRAHWLMYFNYTRKGNDYVNFLLGKFSAKNVFDKIVEPLNIDEPKVLSDQVEDDEQEFDASPEPSASKLKPQEIFDYVNSLKQMAKYWYYTFFPYDSAIGSDIFIDDSEKEWIDRLNRINIAYFRPLVAVILSKIKTTTLEQRLNAYSAIERFVFVLFRMGGYLSTFKSSYYFAKTRELLANQITIDQITQDLQNTTNEHMGAAVSYFIARAKQNFSSREGYYSWNALKYFLFEYEYQQSIKKNISKIEWQMFDKAEKDKITIEHILPQKPSNDYWKQMFAEYNADDIKILTATLGNLLPLSQSINSSLQNDPFPLKKNPPDTKKRRGYINGSHSEIEVSRERDWTAECIYKRGMKLLKFLEERWNVDLTKQQKEALLFLCKQDNKIIVNKS